MTDAELVVLAALEDLVDELGYAPSLCATIKFPKRCKLALRRQSMKSVKQSTKMVPSTVSACKCD